MFRKYHRVYFFTVSTAEVCRERSGLGIRIQYMYTYVYFMHMCVRFFLSVFFKKLFIVQSFTYVSFVPA